MKEPLNFPLVVAAVNDVTTAGHPITDSVDQFKEIIRRAVADHPDLIVPVILETVADELRKNDYRRRHPNIKG